MQSTLYVYGSSLYVNLTNRCPCNCSFCLRNCQDGVGTANSLWLEHDPTVAEVIADFADYNLADYDEVVFCGYGEPLCALDALLEVCRYIRNISDIHIRLNTNGLGDLINQKPTAPLLEGLVDTVSISLNASTAQDYDQICKPSFGLKSHAAMLKFGQDCTRYVSNVVFSVVDVISPEEIAACKALTQKLGIPLRVRTFTN